LVLPWWRRHDANRRRRAGTRDLQPGRYGPRSLLAARAGGTCWEAEAGLGHKIDGRQAEYVRVPYADLSTFRVPGGTTDEEVLMLTDTLPTGYEVGVLAGGVRPGDVVAVVGAGLVDASSTPTLMHLVTSGQIDARRFVTHHFGLDEFDDAYDVFARAADTGALKVVLSRCGE
jgi:threonine dehydrogenase-like Zn-dependent dehydrogenase